MATGGREASSSYPTVAVFAILNAYKALTFLPRYGSVSKFRADGELTMSKLTKRAVDAFIPPTEGQTFLWDGELRGFGVRRHYSDRAEDLHSPIPVR